MDGPLKEKLSKRDILTYFRRNKVLAPPPLATKEFHPPPPPLVHDLPLQPILENEDLYLNIDIPSMIGKMNMVVPMFEMCKIPSVRK
jgi:hypothetical protein